MVKIGIVGYGYVGKSMKKLFPNISDEYIYDEPLNIGSREKINECDMVFVCVPTPMVDSDETFKKCDTSIVEEVVSWIESKYIVIKSTVPPGTTKDLIKKTNKKILFSPEYVGESKYQITEWKYMSKDNPRTHEFVVIGGEQPYLDEVCNYFVNELGPEKTYYLCDATEAETIKYVMNTFSSLKIAYFNQIYDLCQALGISYHKVREGWALDNRVSRMHTSVFTEKRQIDGKCFPKDVNALIVRADELGVDLSILKSAWKSNIARGG